MGLPWDSASTSTHFFTTTSTTSGFFSASEARVTKNMAKPRGCRSSSCRHFMGRSTGQPFHGDLRWFKHQPSWNSPRNPRIPRCEQWIGEKIKTGNNGCFKLWTMVVIWPSNIFCIYIIIYILYICGFLQTSLQRVLGMGSCKTTQPDPIRVVLGGKKTRGKPVQSH